MKIAPYQEQFPDFDLWLFGGWLFSSMQLELDDTTLTLLDN